MYVKNLLRPGDFFEPLPIGIPVTLVYNETLDKIMLNYQKSDYVDITDKLVHQLRGTIVPAKVGITSGTTWVRGVLYTSKLYQYETGELPNCCIDNLINQLLENASDFTFYAGSVESIGHTFSGAAPSRQWLQLSGFKLLQGFLLSSQVSRQDLQKLLLDNSYNFDINLIWGYIVYRKGKPEYLYTHIHQHICTYVEKRLDENGYLHGVVSTEDGEFTVNYSDIVTFNVQCDSIIYQDMYGNILETHNPDRSKAVCSTISCPVCGKPYTVPVSGACICDNDSCLSRTYSKIKHLCNTLKLPIINFDTYKQYIEDGIITTFPDILLVPPLDSLTITTTLVKLLRACIPYDYVSNSNILDKLCNYCNNSIESVRFYLRNPSRIPSECDIPNYECASLVQYLSKLENVSDIETILDDENINIVGTNKKFDGPDIFRDKTIMVTGKFRHGDYDELSAILGSYGAKVVTTFDSSIDCLLIGDIKESINGISVRNCQNLNIPIMEESKFFQMYQIDQDLKQNLA